MDSPAASATLPADGASAAASFFQAMGGAKAGAKRPKAGGAASQTFARFLHRSAVAVTFPSIPPASAETAGPRAVAKGKRGGAGDGSADPASAPAASGPADAPVTPALAALSVSPPIAPASVALARPASEEGGSQPMLIPAGGTDREEEHPSLSGRAGFDECQLDSAGGPAPASSSPEAVPVATSAGSAARIDLTGFALHRAAGSLPPAGAIGPRGDDALTAETAAGAGTPGPTALPNDSARPPLSLSPGAVPPSPLHPQLHASAAMAAPARGAGEKIAANGNASNGDSAGSGLSRQKQSLNTAHETVAPDGRTLGTTGAQTAAVASTSAHPRFGEPSTGATVPAAAAGSTSAPAVPAATAREAIATVSRIAEAQAARADGAASGASMSFRVGDDHLVVRVDVQDGEVRTQFRTDSADLQSALAAQWNGLSSGGSAAGLHFAAPTFASGGADLSSFSQGGSSGQRESGETPQAGSALSASAAAAEDSAAADEPDPTLGQASSALHLHAFA